MDESKENILMCDCPEIQEWRSRRWEHPLLKGKWMSNLSDGDFYYNGYNVKPYHCPNCAGDPEKFKLIFLPRVDQLLKMLDNHKEPLIIEMINVHQWHIKTFSADTGERLIRDVYDRKSCEIALLEIVMILLHNKKWNGEEWNA